MKEKDTIQIQIKKDWHGSINIKDYLKTRNIIGNNEDNFIMTKGPPEDITILYLKYMRQNLDITERQTRRIHK